MRISAPSHSPRPSRLVQVTLWGMLLALPFAATLAAEERPLSSSERNRWLPAHQTVKPRLAVSLRFLKREYREGEPILVRILIQNQTPEAEPVRFRIYANPFFQFRFEMENDVNRGVEKNLAQQAWELERRNGRVEPDAGRLIELRDEESFATQVNLRDFFDVDAPGLYFVSGFFVPNLLLDANEYSFQMEPGSFRLLENKSDVSDSKKGREIQKNYSENELPSGPALSAQNGGETGGAPYEVIDGILQNQQKGNWDLILQNYDLEKILMSSYTGTEIYERFLTARLPEKYALLEEFKKYIIKTSTSKIEEFDIDETRIVGREARVSVRVRLRTPTKQYTQRYNPITGQLDLKWDEAPEQDLHQEGYFNYLLEKSGDRAVDPWKVTRLDVTLSRAQNPKPLRRDPSLLRREGIVLPNILFKLGLAELLPTSFATLNRLRQELLQNPGVKIELHGHTDNVGDRQMNQALSESRASAVRQYLIENGIKGDRIKTAGFGPDKPITDNSSEAARQKNRRVELVVIEGR